MGWTAAAALALSMSASMSLACEQHTQAADVKDPKAVAANGKQAGCDKPCCEKQAATDAKAAPGATPVANVANGVPCDGARAADGKGCPKKAALVAKSESAKDPAKAEPSPNAGANR
jgi:hypothetical protein